MIKGIYDSASGMMPRMTQQDAVANNMANANTIGFKKDRIFIEAVGDAIARQIKTDFDWQKPLIDKSFVDFSQAEIDKTGNELDVAIEGNGFFVVDTENGNRYTRNGQFHLDASGFLTDSRGDKVLSDSGPIVLEIENPTIDEDGNIEVNGEQAARLRIVKFADPQALIRTDGVDFAAPDNVQPEKASGVRIRQGYLERSNVSILNQMIDMITSFRNFEAGQKVVQILDGTTDKSINNLGRIRA